MTVGKIEQLTNTNTLHVKIPEGNKTQIEQINKRLDTIEQHINVIEKIILEFRQLLVPNENQSSA